MNTPGILLLAAVPLATATAQNACEKNGVSNRLLQHVYVIHSPIYPRANEAVTYAATARGKEATGTGIARMSIEVRQYHLGAGAALPLPINLVNAYASSQDFPAHPMEAALNLNVKPYPEDTWVRYSARAELADGTILSDDSIRHVANLREATIGVFKGAIPVYRRGLHADKIDFLFIPEIDYGNNETQYLRDLEDQVNRMFTDPPYRFKRFRRYLNIYANVLRPAFQGEVAPFDAPPPRLLDKPDNFDNAGADDVTWPDVALIMHSQVDFTDWGHRGLLEGRFATVQPNTDVINMEAVHALVELYDEYGLKSPFAPEVEGEHPNLFDSELACQLHVATHPGFSDSHCQQIAEDSDNNDPGSNFNWAWCHDYQGLHNMDSNGTGPFGVEERCRFSWVVSEVLGDPAGSAYGPIWVRGCPGFPCDPLNQTATSAQLPEEETVFRDGYLTEKQLLENEVLGKTLGLAVQLSGTKASLLRAAIRPGPPPNGSLMDRLHSSGPKPLFRVQLLRSGSLLKEHGVSDPRRIGAERGKAEPGSLSDVQWDIRLPWAGLPPDRVRILDRTGRVWLDASVVLAP